MLQQQQQHDYFFPILNVFSFIVVMIVNTLASIGSFNNVDTAQVSDEYMTSITPAGWAFAIWGLIYSYIAIVVFYGAFQALFMKRRNIPLITSEGNEGISKYLLALNFLLNCCWMIVWQYSARGNTKLLWLTLVFMFAILATLIGMYVRVVGESCYLTSSPNNNSSSNFVKYAIRPMVSMYMAWISVAAIINVSVTLTANLSIGEGNMYERTLWGINHAHWSCVLQVVAVGLAVIFLFWRRDVILAGVFSWALYAISNKQESAQVKMCAFVCASILAFLVGCTVVFNVFVKNRADGRTGKEN